MKKTIFKKIIYTTLFILSLLFVFGLGYFYGFRQVPKPPAGLPEGIDLSVVWEVWRTIEKKYVGEIDYQKMIYGAAKGIAQSLGDPYTVFYTPKESKMFLEDVSGSFEGVGMEIGIRNGKLTVVAPLKDTPAYKAGLLPGDIIVSIDGLSTQDLTIYEAVKMIRGKKGTVVRLGIYREGWKEPREFQIIRAVINVPSVKIEILEDKIAHLSIYQFNENTTEQFIKAVEVMQREGAKKIILDLRNNPGGLLDKVQEIAGWFLPKGSTLVVARYVQKKEVLKTKGPATLLHLPLVVLINKGTASGAEILAAALKENRDDVKLIGERTFGKGSVQEAIEIGRIKKEGLLKVTSAHWYTSKDHLLDKLGLTPDIEITLSEEDVKEKKDPQLEKAKEILTNF